MSENLVQSSKLFIKRFPKFANVYRVLRDYLTPLGKSELTPWNFKMAGNPAMINGSFEPVETRLVRSMLKEVDMLINVGANIGYYCCHALSMGKPVIAFEPMQRNLKYLYKNIKSNGWSDGIEIFPIALSDKSGLMKIYGAGTGASSIKGWAGIPESYVTTVPVSTMDAILGNSLSGKKCLIIVDIEGAEKNMLLGAQKILLNEPRPVWMVEIATSQNQPKGVGLNPNFFSTFKIYFDNEYEAYSIGEEISPLSIAEVGEIESGQKSLETYNFLFK